MGLPSWCDKTVAVIRAPETSERGSMVRDWAHATRHDVSGCCVQPSSMQLDTGDRERHQTVSWGLWLPPDADIMDGDHVEYNGREYEIADGVQPYEDPLLGRISHLYATIRGWEG